MKQILALFSSFVLLQGQLFGQSTIVFNPFPIPLRLEFAASKPTFGGSAIDSVVNGAGSNASFASGVLTLAPDTDVMLAKSVDQQATTRVLAPTGTTGGAYAACPTPDIGTGQPADTSFWLLKPDVASAGGDTLNICGEGALALQKMRYGALTNIAANDLQTTGRYFVFKGASTYIVLPAEFRFYEDGTYFYLGLGISGGNGIIIRQAKGVNSFDIRRGDNTDYGILDGVAEVRGKDSSGNVIWSMNPTATAGTKAYFFSTGTTGDDPEKGTYQNIVQTTDATVTTLLTIPITNNRTSLIRAFVTAECESGAGCTANDGAGFVLTCTYRAAAGTATEIGDAVSPTAQSDASLTLALGCAASAGNALIQVTGEATSTIRWTGTAEVYQ